MASVTSGGSATRPIGIPPVMRCLTCSSAIQRSSNEVEQQGQHYLVAAFGVVGWVHNLRAAGEATLTRSRRSETIKAIELEPKEAAPVLKACLASTDEHPSRSLRPGGSSCSALVDAGLYP
jgi:hypothetical protein